MTFHLYLRMVLTWKNAGGNVCVAPGPEAADHGKVNFARSVRGGPDMVTEPGSSLTYA